MVLAVKSEAELAAVERKLQKAGVPHVAIREPDAPWNGALTAIGLVPTRDRDGARRILSSLPLLGKGGVKIMPILPGDEKADAIVASLMKRTALQSESKKLERKVAK